MTTWMLALLVVGVVIAALGGLMAWRSSQRRSLRQQFGPEYDRAVEVAGDRRAAEKDLQQRMAHLKGVELRELPPEEKRELATEWRKVQVDFVDRPQQAVEAADKLVTETMRRRGYPDGDFQQRLADASVEHPHVANDYRQARRIAELNRTGSASTEDLRRAMVCYRSLFQALLGIDETPPLDATAAGTTVRNVHH
jgi:hypothetical protein